MEACSSWRSLAAAFLYNGPYSNVRFLYSEIIFKESEKDVGWQGQTISFIQLLNFYCLYVELKRMAFEMLCALLSCTLTFTFPLPEREEAEQDLHADRKRNTAFVGPVDLREVGILSLFLNKINLMDETNV